MSIYGNFLESYNSGNYMVQVNDFQKLPKVITGLKMIKPSGAKEIKALAHNFLKGEPIADNEFSAIGIKIANNMPAHINLALREDAMLMEGLFGGGKKKNSNSGLSVEVIGKTSSGALVGVCNAININGQFVYLYDTQYFSILNDSNVLNLYKVAYFINDNFEILMEKVLNFMVESNGGEYITPGEITKNLKKWNLFKPVRVEMWSDIGESNECEIVAAMYFQGNYTGPERKNLKEITSNFLCAVRVFPYSGRYSYGYMELDK